MDISLNDINTLTLECFSNRLQYNSIIKKNMRRNDSDFISEKKFYKKRILDLTKKLFKNNSNDLQINNSFDLYIRCCILHLKNIDKSDILQEKYNNTDDNIIMLDNSCNSFDTYELSNELLFKAQEVKHINLDTFIINKSEKKDKILPKKQIFNIKTNEYKIKGIKKKNIINIYEENDKKDKKDIKT